MNLGGTIRLAVAFIVLLLLHFTLRPLLGWKAELDFLTIALLIASVRLRPGNAAVLGLVLGLVNDAQTPVTFGSTALAMTAVGFGASWLKAVFFADNIALNAMMFFLGKWAIDVVRFGTLRMPAGQLAQQLFVWSPLSAFITAIAGVVVLLLLRPLLEPQRA